MHLCLRSIPDKEELITRIIAINCQNKIAFCLCIPKNYVKYLTIAHVDVAWSYHNESFFNLGGNENIKSLSNDHLQFLKYLLFVFAVCQIQPLRAVAVAQKSIATEKFQANWFPPKQQSKMFERTKNYC